MFQLLKNIWTKTFKHFKITSGAICTNILSKFLLSFCMYFTKYSLLYSFSTFVHITSRSYERFFSHHFRTQNRVYSIRGDNFESSVGNDQVSLNKYQTNYIYILNNALWSFTHKKISIFLNLLHNTIMKCK